LAELFSVTHPCLLLGVLVASQRPQHVRMRKILCLQLFHSRFLALHELAATLLLPLRSFHPTHILGAFTGLLRRPLVGVQRVPPVIPLQVFGGLVRSNRVVPIRLVDRLTALLAVLADRPLKRLHIDTASAASAARRSRDSRQTATSRPETIHIAIPMPQSRSAQLRVHSELVGAQPVPIQHARSQTALRQFRRCCGRVKHAPQNRGQSGTPRAARTCVACNIRRAETTVLVLSGFDLTRERVVTIRHVSLPSTHEGSTQRT